MSQQQKVAVVGSLNMDVVIKVAKPPAVGETVLGEDVFFLPGGKGANQAVAAARLGAATSMIGAIGEDAFGNELAQSLEREGISSATVQRIAGKPTGTASIVLSEGDNSIIVVPGANAACSPESVQQQEQLIANADIVLLQLEVPLDTVVAAAKLARQHGTAVVLNPAPAQALPKELLACVDYLTPNRSELALLAGMPEPDYAAAVQVEGENGAGAESAGAKSVQALEEAWLVAAMQKLAAAGVGQVIATLGSAGAAFLDQAHQLVRVPGRKMDVVDTTGAGDCFNAGLACALARGESLGQAMHYAIAASALSVTRLGAQGGMPRHEEVGRLLQG